MSHEPDRGGVASAVGRVQYSRVLDEGVGRGHAVVRRDIDSSISQFVGGWSPACSDL